MKFFPGELLVLNHPYNENSLDCEQTIVVAIKQNLNRSLSYMNIDIIIWEVMVDDGTILKVPETWLKKIE